MHGRDRLSPLQRESLFVCPSCRSPLRRVETGWNCDREEIAFCMTEGIPDFILPSRRPNVERFLVLYQAVRKAEGWRIDDRNSLINLPYPEGNTRFRNLWQLRARTYEYFMTLLNLRAGPTPLKILDLGAGNCWMAYRLAESHRSIVAVDINADFFDGLGVSGAVLEKAERSVIQICAEYDSLPFPDGSFDIACFNASLHYSRDPVQTVLRTFNVLNDGGSIYVLDSPLYRDPESGRRMVMERQEKYRSLYHIELPDDLAGGFLTYTQLEQLRRECSVEIIRPKYGFLWNLRPNVARLLGRREPATFAILHIRR